MFVVVCEKPSVARDIARVLGAEVKHSGYFAGKECLVTWAFGHLVKIAEPHEMNPGWKKWDAASLPMIPKKWEFGLIEESKQQFLVIKELLHLPEVEHVIAGTDAGREGELIFRLIYQEAKCKKPIKRLWLSSLTEASIKKAFDRLEEGIAYEPLYHSALTRAQADWLVGMNFSRLYSLLYQEMYTVGRVQTPTLSLLAARSEERRDFKSEKYFEAKLLVQGNEDSPNPSFETIYSKSVEGKNKLTEKPNLLTKAKIPFEEKEKTEEILERSKKAKGKVFYLGDQETKLSPPKFYDLTELQRHGSRLFSFTANEVLEIAQRLYETHKLITYPRTDCQVVSQDIAAQFPQVVEEIKSPYQDKLREDTGIAPLSKRFVDDSQIKDHHAIIPTGKLAKNLGSEEAKIFDLITRRFLQAWQEDAITSTTTIVSEFSGKSFKDYYVTRGQRLIQEGWKRIEYTKRRGESAELGRGGSGGTREPSLPQREEHKTKKENLPSLIQLGDQLKVVSSLLEEKSTHPPSLYSDATLLSAMEHAESWVEDKELAATLKKTGGLGTSATRSQIIENLIKRNYCTRNGTTIEATTKGEELIQRVHPHLKTPKLTAEWEEALEKIAQKTQSHQAFNQELAEFLNTLTSEIKSETRQPLPPKIPTLTLEEALRDKFGFKSFRPFQEPICEALIKGQDALLIMPTGAGKSLCYQLPPLVLGRPCLVVSPLISLMEDQVKKLCDKNIAAKTLHSGTDREEARQMCREFMQGTLQFLFVAPERLALSGFTDFLQKCNPALIAIDEAHCISQWGHDFRADYRMLKERLAPFTATPIVAMTATATPKVQDDIIQQLDLKNCFTYLGGFWRDNIALSLEEASYSEAFPNIKKLLKQHGNLPAIIYVPTRKTCEKLTGDLLAHFADVAYYHAGQTPLQRKKVQTQFIQGNLQVIVATIAFGMGIDKENVRLVIHLGLPGSVEGYYQEIGRAGRDGNPSKAILFYSYADRHKHLYFHKQNYPDLPDLKKLMEKIPEKGSLSREKLAGVFAEEKLDNCLQKLRIHGALTITSVGELARCANKTWEKQYIKQKDHASNQLQAMLAYTKNASMCRMHYLIDYFGQELGKQAACGHCDVCAKGHKKKGKRVWKWNVFSQDEDASLNI